MVYQIVRALCSGSARKTHTYERGSGRTVITYRDFRDVLVSFWRLKLDPADKGYHYVEPAHGPAHRDFVVQKEKSLGVMGRADVSAYCVLVAHEVVQLDQYREAGGSSQLWLKYEEFWNDPELLFGKLLPFLELDIPMHQQSALWEHCSLSANRQRAARLNSFLEVDPDSEIHGLHVGTGSVGGWRNQILMKDQEIVARQLGNALVRYGYETSPDPTKWLEEPGGALSVREVLAVSETDDVR